MGGVSADGRTLWLSGRNDGVVYGFDTGTGRLDREDPGRRQPARHRGLAAARPLLAGPHREHAVRPGLRRGGRVECAGPGRCAAGSSSEPRPARPGAEPHAVLVEPPRLGRPFVPRSGHGVARRPGGSRSPAARQARGPGRRRRGGDRRRPAWRATVSTGAVTHRPGDRPDDAGSRPGRAGPRRRRGPRSAGRRLVVGGGNATEQDVVQARPGRAGTSSVTCPRPGPTSASSPWGATPMSSAGTTARATPTQILSLDARRTVASGRAPGARRPVRRDRARAATRRTCFGGEVLGQELATVQAVDLATGRTRVVARLPVPLGHAMAATVGGRILLLGGRVAPDRQTAAMWWFDPASGRFTPARAACRGAQRRRGRGVPPPASGCSGGRTRRSPTGCPEISVR